MNCLPKSSIRKISEIYWKYSFWYGIFLLNFLQFHSDINEILILYRRFIVILSSLIIEVSYVNLMYSNSRHHLRTHFRTVHHSFRYEIHSISQSFIKNRISRIHLDLSVERKSWWLYTFRLYRDSISIIWTSLGSWVRYWVVILSSSWQLVWRLTFLDWSLFYWSGNHYWTGFQLHTKWYHKTASVTERNVFLHVRTDNIFFVQLFTPQYFFRCSTRLFRIVSLSQSRVWFCWLCWCQNQK